MQRMLRNPHGPDNERARGFREEQDAEDETEERRNPSHGGIGTTECILHVFRERCNK